MAADDEPTFTAEQVVSAAYHALLDREPTKRAGKPTSGGCWAGIR